MSGISHKQAIRWVDRRLDGMLNQSRLLLLEEHLRACESCRTYASEVDSMPARLQHEFHTRWDPQPGPSHRVMEQVMTKAKRIPMATRFYSSLRLAAGVAALLFLVIVLNSLIPTVHNSASSRKTEIPLATNLRIDPQSCKSASELNSKLQPPHELNNYKIIQGTSFVSGDFSYEFWLYCDPSLSPENANHYSAIASLGIYGSWRYDGPGVEGANQYYFEFTSNAPLGRTSWNGPFYKASGSGVFGIDLPERTLQTRIQQGIPIQFNVIVDSGLGQNGSTVSFDLQPTNRGYKVAGLRTTNFNHIENGLITFTSNQPGNADIYTMRSDGSELANLSHNPANDYLPQWSPDGTKIAFISERNGSADIFVMNSDGSNLTQLTDNRGYDGIFSWSSDGTKIAYLSSSGNDPNAAQLIVMNADGSDKTTLTDIGSYFILGWSPSGQKIVYQKQDPGGNLQNNEIHVSDIDGSNHFQWTATVDEIQWIDEEHFFGFGFSGQSDESPRWLLYRFSANGDPPSTIASHDSSIIDLLKDTHVVEGGTIMAWYSSDGNPTPYQNWNFFDVCGQGFDRFIPQASYIAAPNENRALIVIPCNNSGTTWFYIDSRDGSAIRKLTDFTVKGTGNIQDLKWSPDGKYGIMILSNSEDAKTDLYLFDIDKMLQDPSTQPIRLTSDGAAKTDAAWQPKP